MKYLNVTRRSVTMAAVMIGGLFLMQALAASVAFARQLTARKYYLTKERSFGSNALTACASGFHMASLWEIFNPAVLEYDTTLGRLATIQAPDRPLSCSAWTSNTAPEGSTVELESVWDSTTLNPIRPWKAGIANCSDIGLSVWCVQDFSD